MGGNALTNYKAIRLNKERFEPLAQDCVLKLKALYPNNRVAALGSYRSKEDFGDCDILIESVGFDPHEAAAVLNPVEVVRNGPVTSVGVLVDQALPAGDDNVFQVDLIKMESSAFEFAQGYFGASDTGNLVGRIGHAQGLSVRHDGLFFYHRDGDYKFREILLTQDFAEALTFMGYKPETYYAGFDTLDDIYQFVASTPFFNRDIFLLHNRNAKARVRDKKRKVYMEFLQWCEARPDLTYYHYPDNKSEWLERISAHFPHFAAEYAKSLADLGELRCVKDKFNGAFVARISGLQGKELGGLMKRFKESFSSAEQQRQYVLNASLEDLELRIKQLLASKSP